MGTIAFRLERSAKINHLQLTNKKFRLDLDVLADELPIAAVQVIDNRLALRL